jgi:putative cell wall-binding protein
MVNNRQLTPSQKEFLAGADRKFVIIGGESAVSADMAAQLEAYGTIERIGGSNRYETSINVAKRFFSDPSAVVLAYGANFPDGLCGGPLAYAVGAPLILTRDVNASLAAAYTAEQGITNGAVLGGPSLISDNAVSTILSQ